MGGGDWVGYAIDVSTSLGHHNTLNRPSVA